MAVPRKEEVVTDLVTYLGEQMPESAAIAWKLKMTESMTTGIDHDYLPMLWVAFVLDILQDRHIWHCQIGGEANIYGPKDVKDVVKPVVALYERILKEGLGAVSNGEWYDAAKHAKDVADERWEHRNGETYGGFQVCEHLGLIYNSFHDSWARAAAAAALWDVAATMEHTAQAMTFMRWENKRCLFDPWWQQEKCLFDEWWADWAGNWLGSYVELASKLYFQIGPTRTRCLHKNDPVYTDDDRPF